MTKIVNEAMWLIRLLVSLAVLVILLGATEYMGDTYRWVLPAAHLITR